MCWCRRSPSLLYTNSQPITPGNGELFYSINFFARCVFVCVRVCEQRFFLQSVFILFWQHGFYYRALEHGGKIRWGGSIGAGEMASYRDNLVDDDDGDDDRDDYTSMMMTMSVGLLSAKGDWETFLSSAFCMNLYYMCRNGKSSTTFWAFGFRFFFVIFFSSSEVCGDGGTTSRCFTSQLFFKKT